MITSTCLDSDSGTFVGLGTITGSVAIYIAFSLQVNVLQVKWRRAAV